MQKRAIILDLDNTIYAVHSIGDELFAVLFQLILADGHHADEFEKIRTDIMRRPFQLVAKDYHFNEALLQKGIDLLKNLQYKGKMEFFDDYPFVKSLPLDKFLVTTGFQKLQQSKIDGLKLNNDFMEIHIVDPLTSDRTKKHVFADILQRHRYSREEVVVIGDDLNSEIKAAQELGIEPILYDKIHRYPTFDKIKKIADFRELGNILQTI